MQCRLRRQPDGDHGVQQPAALVAQVGDVVVLRGQDRKARQQRVAVMAVLVDAIAPVGVLPALLGEELVLRGAWPALEAQREAVVDRLHFLQEDEVGVELAQALAQLVDHHAAVERRQALVDVECDYA